MSTTGYCNHPRWIWMAQGNIPEGLQLIWLSPEREVLHYFSHKQTWSPLRCLTATIEGRIDEPSEDPIILYSCVESFSRGFARVFYDFQLTTGVSKVKRSNLKLHCWKETAAEQIKILNKTTTPQHLVSPAEYLKGVLSRSTYIHILSFLLVLFIHITQQINMSIYYIYMIYHPYFVKPSRFLYQYYDQFFIETENLLFFLFCWFGGTWYFSSTASTFRVLRKR